MAAPQQTFKLAASVFAVVVFSALITFVVTRHLDQEVRQLEKAANALYQSAVSVYHYPLKRAEQTGNTSPVCSALDSRLGDFSATTATFDTDNFDLADANRLTTPFSHYSIGAIEASPAAGARRQWTSIVTAYLALIKRRGRLIPGLTPRPSPSPRPQPQPRPSLS